MIISWAPQLLPVADPWMTSKTFKHAKGVKESILWQGPRHECPSLPIATIAPQELYNCSV